MGTISTLLVISSYNFLLRTVQFLNTMEKSSIAKKAISTNDRIEAPTANPNHPPTVAVEKILNDGQLVS